MSPVVHTGALVHLVLEALVDDLLLAQGDQVIERVPGDARSVQGRSKATGEPSSPPSS